MIGADLGRVLALGSVPIAYAVGAADAGPALHRHPCQRHPHRLLRRGLPVVSPRLGRAGAPGRGQRQADRRRAGCSRRRPGVAGGLVQAIGSSGAVAVDSVSFLVSAVAVGAIRRPSRSPSRPRGPPEARPRHRRRPPLRVRQRAAPGHRGDHRDLEPVQRDRRGGGDRLLGAQVHASPGVIGLLFTLGGVGGVMGALAAGPIARRFGGARATMIGIAGNVGGLLMPLTMPGAGLLLFGIGLHVRVVLRRRLQHQPGQLPAATVPGPAAGADERDHAIRRLGRAAHRRARRRGPRERLVGLRQTLWIGVVGQALAGVWLLASPMRTHAGLPRDTRADTAGTARA